MDCTHLLYIRYTLISYITTKLPQKCCMPYRKFDIVINVKRVTVQLHFITRAPLRENQYTKFDVLRGSTFQKDFLLALLQFTCLICLRC